MPERLGVYENNQEREFSWLRLKIIKRIRKQCAIKIWNLLISKAYRKEHHVLIRTEARHRRLYVLVRKFTLHVQSV